MTLYDLSGTAAGTGTSSLGTGQVTHFAHTLMGGAAGLSASAVQVMIFTGRTGGSGTTFDDLLVSVSGTAAGVGSLTGTASHMINLSGFAEGSGSFNVSIPEQIFGIGTLVGFLEVQHVPPPVCGPICGCGSCCGRYETHCEDCRQWHDRRHHREAWWWQCRECWGRHAWHQDEHRHGEHEWSREPNPGGRIGSFRWNQTLGRGDLEICLQDRWRNQRGPVFIGYTMFMVSPTGVLHQVGPTDRKPAQWDVGKFYVTGTAGENGQPGCWAVRWRYQKTYSEPIVEQLVQFRVLDAVLDCDRPDHLRRKCKFGWDL